MDSEDFGRLGYLVIILIALAGWFFVEYRGRMGVGFRAAMAWVLIFAGAAAGYALWTDIRRNDMPLQMVDASGTIEVPRASDGHYYLTLMIGGTPLRFMADTGATNVVLTPDDARSIGIDPDALVYMDRARTANGTVAIARTRMQDVTLGPFQDARVTAWVNAGDLDISLLGMEYLGRYRIEIDGNVMRLSR